jgi:hypothetical protein
MKSAILCGQFPIYPKGKKFDDARSGMQSDPGASVSPFSAEKGRH